MARPELTFMLEPTSKQAVDRDLEYQVVSEFFCTLDLWAQGWGELQ